MSSELRHAVEVWLDAYEASYYDEVDDDQAASAVIEADRKAVRAPLLAEIERLTLTVRKLQGNQAALEAEVKLLEEQLAELIEEKRGRP